jgi:hypothetical protein
VIGIWLLPLLVSSANMNLHHLFLVFVPLSCGPSHGVCGLFIVNTREMRVQIARSVSWALGSHENPKSPIHYSANDLIQSVSGHPQMI